MAQSILDSSEDQLKMAQAKITYLGEQTKPIPTIAFYTEGHRLAMETFVQFQQGQREYDNDSLPYTQTFRVTPVEFRRLLLAAKPRLIPAAKSANPNYLSFCVVRKEAGGQVGEEFWIEPAAGAVFHRAVMEALESQNDAGRKALAGQATKLYGE